MVEVVVLIPVNSNEGVMFTPAHHEAFRLFILARFTGVSVLPGLVDGVWLEAGTLYTDSTIIYSIAVAGLLADGAKLMEIVEFAKLHYGQLKIFVRYLGLAEVL